MQPDAWLRALRAKLNARKLPALYVDRLVDELRDHTADLIKEDEMANGMSVGTDLSSRLGTVEAVADEAATHYRASWLARHPMVAFLVAPVPMVVVAWIVYMVIGGVLFFTILPMIHGALALEGKPAHEWVPGVLWGALVFHAGLKFVPPVIVSVIACLLVHRCGQDWRWALVACGVVGVVAGLFNSSLVLPIEPGSGSFSIGFSLPPSTPQLAQCLVPLLVGGLLVWRYRHLCRGANSEAANAA